MLSCVASPLHPVVDRGWGCGWGQQILVLVEGFLESPADAGGGGGGALHQRGVQLDDLLPHVVLDWKTTTLGFTATVNG